MRIHDLERPATRPLAPATRRRHRRAVLLGAGAIALALATIGTISTLIGRSSLATQAYAPSVAGPSSIAGASAATQQSRRAQVAPNSTTSTSSSPVLADGTHPTYIAEVGRRQLHDHDRCHPGVRERSCRQRCHRGRHGPGEGPVSVHLRPQPEPPVAHAAGRSRRAYRVRRWLRNAP